MLFRMVPQEMEIVQVGSGAGVSCGAAGVSEARTLLPVPAVSDQQPVLFPGPLSEPYPDLPPEPCPGSLPVLFPETMPAERFHPMPSLRQRKLRQRMLRKIWRNFLNRTAYPRLTSFLSGRMKYSASPLKRTALSKGCLSD
jgi:hypothetical protein